MERKNIIRIVIKVAVLTMLIVLGIVFLVANWLKNIYENPLENISFESAQGPSYMVYGSLYSDYGDLQIGSVCVKQNEDFNLKEVLCVEDGKVYFVYWAPYKESYCWELGSIDLTSLEFETHCRFIEPAEDYAYREFQKDYKFQNGFYFENQIILTDHQKVLVYDLEQQNSKIYTYNEYIFPKKTVYGEAIDAETIKVINNGVTLEYSLREMAEKSESIAQIFELKEELIWNGYSPLKSFFDDFSVQEVNDKIYAVCQCLNYKGYAYAVILEYMETTDSWIYVGSARSAAGDIVHGRCYMVP